MKRSRSQNGSSRSGGDGNRRSGDGSGSGGEENEYPKVPRLETTESDSLPLVSNPERLQFIFQLFETTKQRLFTPNATRFKQQIQNEGIEEDENEELQSKAPRVWLKPRLGNANHLLIKLPLKIQFCIFEYLDYFDRYQLSLTCAFYQNSVGIFEIVRRPKCLLNTLQRSDEANAEFKKDQDLIKELELWAKYCLNPTFDSFDLEESKFLPDKEEEMQTFGEEWKRLGHEQVLWEENEEEEEEEDPFMKLENLQFQIEDQLFE